jgi:hypothetical protein
MLKAGGHKKTLHGALSSLCAMLRMADAARQRGNFQPKARNDP